MDVSTIDLQALDDAIEDATTVGCTTTEAHNLLETAILVRNIRGALSGGAWAKLRNELARSLTVAVVEISKVEIRVARDEAAQLRVGLAAAKRADSRRPAPPPAAGAECGRAALIKEGFELRERAASLARRAETAQAAAAARLRF